MKSSISELYGLHEGETIWIVGSGSSMNHVSRTFFDDKVSITVNEVFRDFGATYAFAHHREPAQEAIDRGLIVVASEYCRCDIADGLNDLHGNWYSYKHPQQPNVLRMEMDPLVRDLHDTLVVGSNTVTSAMDFAGRILGASSIILCGVDSGMIDGRVNYDGYNDPTPVNYEEKQTNGGTGIPHMRAQVSLIAVVTEALRKRGVGVHSLNPFVDLGLEGHVFTR